MYRYVLFDLDGTLTDPGEGITNSVMHALRRMGIEPPEREALYPFIGPVRTGSAPWRIIGNTTATAGSSRTA